MTRGTFCYFDAVYVAKIRGLVELFMYTSRDSCTSYGYKNLRLYERSLNQLDPIQQSNSNFLATKFFYKRKVSSLLDKISFWNYRFKFMSRTICWPVPYTFFIIFVTKLDKIVNLFIQYFYPKLFNPHKYIFSS